MKLTKSNHVYRTRTITTATVYVGDKEKGTITAIGDAKAARLYKLASEQYGSNALVKDISTSKETYYMTVDEFFEKANLLTQD